MSIEENTRTISDYQHLENEVRAAIEQDSNYPLGETDHHKWAIAWRLMMNDKNGDLGINIDGLRDDEDIDNTMAAWFANAMASSPEAIQQRREESESFASKDVLETSTPTFHELAMRTAAGPENWFVEENASARRFVTDLFNYVHAARELDRWKSRLIYGKFKDEGKFDDLPFSGDLNNAFDVLKAFPEFVHAILGIGSEAGELVEHLLNTINTESINVTGVNEETGDMFWFSELLAKAIGVTTDQSKADVIAKLTKRYPEKYTQEHAVLRLDKQEG